MSTTSAVVLPQLVQEELARLVDSDALRRAPSHMRLLRYLVEKRVAGDDVALRETSIALEVFRRDPATYDPQTDPIVRVTTGRLRDRLEAHYARFDAPPKMRIVLPKGRYAPEFVAPPGPVAAPVGLAVLTMRDHTGQPEYTAFCAALTDRLTDSLARAGIPRVTPRSSVLLAEAGAPGLATIGERLDVPWVIETVLAREQQAELRLTVRLVHAADGAARWVETGVRAIADQYVLADRMIDIATLRTCETMPGIVAGNGNGGRQAAVSAQSRAALDTVHLLLLQRSIAGTEEAVALATAAVARDPDAADPWASLAAACYSRLSFMDTASEPWVARIHDSVDRALALDSEHPVALRTKAIVTGKHDYDLVAAEALFVRALRTLPNYTSARLNLAESLILQGRFSDALAEINLALVFDPLSPSVRMARALCLRYARRYDDARHEWALCRASGETSMWVLSEAGLNELAAGRLDAAAALFDEMTRRYPDLPTTPMLHAYLSAARGDDAGAREQERACLQRFPQTTPSSRAFLAALLRDREIVLQQLARARAEHDMGFLYAGIEPAYEWLGGDAEFRRILSTGGVPGWRGSRLPAAN
jgi:TolB-like protein/tetratricopeptide (TPR) repeat protein